MDEKMRSNYGMYTFSVGYGAVDLGCFNPTLLRENPGHKLPSRLKLYSFCESFLSRGTHRLDQYYIQMSHDLVSRHLQPFYFWNALENVAFFCLLAKTESLILRLCRDINRKPFLCCKNEDNSDLQLALTGAYSLTFWQLPLSSSVSEQGNHYDPPCQFQPFSTGLLPFYW